MDKIEKVETPEEEVVEEPKIEESEEEPEEPEVEEAPEEEPEIEKAPDAEQPSRRRDLRIKQLVEKLHQKETVEVPKGKGLNYRDALEADDETIQQLEKDRQDYGSNLYQQGLQQVKTIQFHTRLEMDAPKIETKYPQFDKDSDQFNPAVAGAINDWYLATVGYDAKTDTVANANVRYADFVEGIMELADEMAGEKTSRTTKNIAKQAANLGLRPDGSTAKRMNLNQNPEAMSDEELDAIIAQAMPPKTRR